MKVATDSLPKWKVWWLAIRPHTLWAAVCPVMISSALAWEENQFSLSVAFLALVAVISLQAATNLTNDYYDHIRGTDNEERIGPLRVMQAGLVNSQEMRLAMMLCFGVSLLIGAYFSLSLGWGLFALTALSVLAGFMYTGGPFPLGYHGLGDLFAFVFFGPVAVAGTYFLQTAEVSPLAVFIGFAPGCFSVALITVNNLRDVHGDRNAGKKTLAVRMGPLFSRFEYTLSLLVAALIALTFVVFQGKLFFLLIPVVMLVLAAPALRTVWHPMIDGPAMNQTLARTGQLLLIYSLLLSLGWLF